MRRLFAAMVVCLGATVAFAQEAGQTAPSDSDRDYLTALLEDNLSGGDRTVRITGFAGAFSSRATFDELSIADDSGVWLTVRDGAISWSRSALLRGRIEIAEMSAREIDLERLPPGDGASAEASGFALPELPVSVAIDSLRADRVHLGPSVLGTEVSLSLEGSLVLGDGAGQAKLAVKRLGGVDGVLSLDAGYSNATGKLSLDLLGREARDGIAVNLIGLPGAPSVEFAIHGSGSINDFQADVVLSTDGAPRLGGTVTLAKAQETGSAQQFSVRLSGDLAPLFQPEYRDFFGTAAALEADGQRSAAGDLDLERFSLSTRGIDLSGHLAISAGGLPEKAELTAHLGLGDGTAMLLPLTGDPTRLERADLKLSYDRGSGDKWSLSGAVRGFERGGNRIGDIRLSGLGSVQSGSGAVADLRGIDGALEFGAGRIAVADPALADAIGTEVSGRFAFDWQKDAPLHLADIGLKGAGFDISGLADFKIGADGPEVTGEANADVEDMARYSAVAGRDLSGKATMRLKGTAGLLSGIFDVTAEVAGVDLTVDQPEADGLLRGASQVSASVRRDLDGIEIRDFAAKLEAAEIGARGKVSSKSIALDISATLDDLSALGAAYGGSLAARASVTGAPDALTVNLTGQSEDLSLGSAEADRVLAGSTQLALQAERTAGRFWLNSLSLNNRNLTAKAEGTDAAGAQQLTLSLALRDMALLTPDFPGPLNVSGTVVEDGANYRLNLEATGPGATKAELGGSVSAALDRADLAVRGSLQSGILNPFLAPQHIDGPVSFDIRVAGPLTLNSVTGTITASDLRLVAPTLGAELQQISLRVTAANAKAEVSAQARVKGGGRLELSGPIGMTSPFRADLSVRMDGVVLQDPQLYETMATGLVQLTGPLTGGAIARGSITLGTTEIRVATDGFGSAAALPGLEHINEPEASRETRRRAGLLKEGGPEGAGASYGLDIRLNAPGRLFVRGRGLDAELGGAIRITGTTDNATPVGQFRLIRGRLDILGKRFTIDEGQVQLQGALVPYIRFAASTESDGITGTIMIEGDATEPEVRFYSNPELPEEEVIAHILFGRSLANLSAFQAAQLASAVATLAGKGGEGLVARLRSGIGLDDLDVTTDESGAAALRAGKYLSEKVYSDLTVGSDGTSRINLNFDVRKDLTLKGSVGSDGSTGVGVYYERNY
ncbi:MAG: translocation/assembly module TamB domain-containing protein [Rhodobacteraceae bacterium]|nr:translocation/assembly module TamB domain-containing protein [Paracoccaceae bacterium]